jgi:soluble lytic murein transglycosylase
VGARGLMQLMPGTARMTAQAAGVTYDLSSLTLDPQHNMRLGATYFGQLMTRFDGSYILSVAAYNAGPGNVNKWIAANGDPRQPGVDPLRWIENIPFTETRGYVQRVLENYVVYDQLSPRNPQGGTWLTALLAPKGQVAGGSR